MLRLRACLSGRCLRSSPGRLRPVRLPVLTDGGLASIPLPSIKDYTKVS
jgi:hypothetical protein